MVKKQPQNPELNLQDLIVNNPNAKIRIDIKKADQEARRKTNDQQTERESHHNFNWEFSA